MGARLNVQVLAALASGALPAHVVRRRLRAPVGAVHASLGALERRRLVRRTDAAYRLTALGRDLLRAELALARLLS